MADVADGDATAGRRGQWLKRTVQVAFGLAVVGFGTEYIVSRWGELAEALDQSHPGWIVVAVVFAAAGQWAAAFGFRAVLAVTAEWLPVRDIARVYYISQLGKYIPGSVWPIVALTAMCRKYGLRPAAGAVCGVISLAFSVLTGACVGLILTLGASAGGSPSMWWLALLIPIAVAALHPRVVRRVVTLLLRVTRQPPVALRLHGRPLREALGWPVVSWLLLGLHCWTLVLAVGGNWSTIVGAIGGFALAYVAGTLFIPAPAGAGVREAVLGVALAGVAATSASFGQPQVVLVVLLSRVLLAFLDFAQAGSAVIWARGRMAETA